MNWYIIIAAVYCTSQQTSGIRGLFYIQYMVIRYLWFFVCPTLPYLPNNRQTRTSRCIHRARDIPSAAVT